LNKQDKYKKLIQQAEVLIDPSIDRIGNMANLSSLIATHFEHHWIGFYRVKDKSLILGPFQGPVACTNISYGKGVCGTAWKTKTTQVVSDVHSFQGHIACSPYSNSEIVIPCLENEKVYAVLDLDSTEFNAFDTTDVKYLEQLVRLL
jgi:GAF domain-containing protein